MDHQTLRLVDHQHIIVFVHDVQRHLRGHDVHFLGFRQRHGDLIAYIQFVVFLSGLTVSQNAAFLQQLLHTGTAHIFNTAGHEGIQTLAGNVGNQHHFFFSSFQNSLLIRNRCKSSRIALQVIKQSATLNTGNTMKSVSIISTT